LLQGQERAAKPGAESGCCPEPAPGPASSDAPWKATGLLSQRPEGLTLLDRLGPGPLAADRPGAGPPRHFESGEGWQSVLHNAWPADRPAGELQMGTWPPTACWQQQWAEPQRFSARCAPEGLPNPGPRAAVLACVCEQRQRSERAGLAAAWQDLAACAPLGGLLTAWRAKEEAGPGGKRSSCSPTVGTTAPSGGTAERATAAMVTASAGSALAAFGQPLEAWEMWRNTSGRHEPQPGTAGPGGPGCVRGSADDWTGLEPAASGRNLRWIAPPCPSASTWSVHSIDVLLRNGVLPGAQAANGIDPRVFAGCGQAGSRLRRGRVTSGSRPVGLLQLMPGHRRRA